MLIEAIDETAELILYNPLAYCGNLLSLSIPWIPNEPENRSGFSLKVRWLLYISESVNGGIMDNTVLALALICLTMVTLAAIGNHTATKAVDAVLKMFRVKWLSSVI